MAGNFPEFKTGQVISAFDSSFLNTLVEMANAQPGPAAGGADTIVRPADTVLVLNSTGADLDLGASAAIVSPMVTPAVEDVEDPQFATNLVMDATDDSCVDTDLPFSGPYYDQGPWGGGGRIMC